ncbi:hypothetical protein JL722_9662 [Aureococcus anophagefferens]|nr:hypothetical protein JL722_9662 [Aureococcus anophagefferens]
MRLHRWIALLCISAKTFPTRADDDDDVAHFIAQLRAEANAAYDGDADVSAAVGRAAFVESFVANGLEAAARELRERRVPAVDELDTATSRVALPCDGCGRALAADVATAEDAAALVAAATAAMAALFHQGGGRRALSSTGHAYWEPHVDRDNVAAYAYSALVYLGDQGADFAGGTLEFLDGDGARAVRPRRGLLVAFSSGAENAHRVSRVTAGDRFSLAFWFAADGVT